MLDGVLFVVAMLYLLGMFWVLVFRDRIDVMELVLIHIFLGVLTLPITAVVMTYHAAKEYGAKE